MKRNNRFYLSIYGPILVVFISLGSLAAGNQDIFAQIKKGPDLIAFNTIFQQENARIDCLDCSLTHKKWVITDYTKEEYLEELSA